MDVQKPLIYLDSNQNLNSLDVTRNLFGICSNTMLSTTKTRLRKQLWVKEDNQTLTLLNL
jgi:hypothetical protein